MSLFRKVGRTLVRLWLLFRPWVVDAISRRYGGHSEGSGELPGPDTPADTSQVERSTSSSTRRESDK